MPWVFRISRYDLFLGFFYPSLTFHARWVFPCCNTAAIGSLCHLLFTNQFFSIDSSDVFSHQWLQIQSHQTEMTSPTGNTDCSTVLLGVFFQEWHLYTPKCNYCKTQGLHTGFIIYVSSRFNRIKESEAGDGSSGWPSFHRLYTRNESKRMKTLREGKKKQQWTLLPAFPHALCNRIICRMKRAKSRDEQTWFFCVFLPFFLN